MDELNEVRARLAVAVPREARGQRVRRPALRARAAGRRTTSKWSSRARPRSATGRASDSVSSESRPASTTRRSTDSAATATEGSSLPVAEEIADRVVTLPLHPKLADADVDVVCDALLEQRLMRVALCADGRSPHTQRWANAVADRGHEVAVVWVSERLRGR